MAVMGPLKRQCGGVNDTINLAWYDLAWPTAMSGISASPTTLGIPTVGGRSLQQPGARFRFRTGPSVAAAGPYIESEWGGFRASSFSLVAFGSPGLTTPPTLVTHERVLGFLAANDDVVRMRLPANASQAVVALWLANPNTDLVTLWARCSAQPDRVSGTIVADQWSNTYPYVYAPEWSGASLVLPACTTGWHLAVTNTSATAQQFHMVWSFNTPAYALQNIRVALAWNATATEVADIRDRVREGSWRFWAMSGGARPPFGATIYNNSPACADGPGPAALACGGGQCDVCWLNTDTGCRPRAYAHGIAMCRSSNANTLAHEYGHRFLGLGDEYVDVGTLACPDYVAGTWSWCPMSRMGGGPLAAPNRMALCTSLDHRRPSPDWRGLPANAAFAPVNNGIRSYDCNGGYYEGTVATSAWVGVNAWAPIDHSLVVTPHGVPMRHFWDDPHFAVY